MALDNQLLLAMTTSVASATFLVGFLSNQFHRTLDFARAAAAREDEEILTTTHASVSTVLERQHQQSASASKGVPLDWVWLAVVTAIAVAATALAVAAAVVPKQRVVSASGIWTVVTLVVLTWLVVSAAAWDWVRTGRELVRVRESTYSSAIARLRDELASWWNAVYGPADASRVGAPVIDVIRHRVEAVRTARLLVSRFPGPDQSGLAAVARGWAACALIAQAADIAGGRMTDEEARVATHSGADSPTVASELAAGALGDLWASVSSLADGAPLHLLMASAWAVEAAHGLEQRPPQPEALPEDWEVCCLEQASRRYHTGGLDVALGRSAAGVMPSWRVYDRALCRRHGGPADPYSALGLLDELILQVDRIALAEPRRDGQAAAIKHARWLIPEMIASGPGGPATARAYLWKWPFLTTSTPQLSGSWIEPVARELRQRYLDRPDSS